MTYEEFLKEMKKRTEYGIMLVYPQRVSQWKEEMENWSINHNDLFVIDVTLNMMKALDDGGWFAPIYDYFENFKSSGMSNQIITLVTKYSRYGVDFFKYTLARDNWHLDDESAHLLKQIEEENKAFENELNSEKENS